MKTRTFSGGLVVLALVALATPHFAWADGKATFEKKCHKCHALPNPDNPPSEGWVKRLDLMAPKAHLNAAQKAEVLSYLMEHSKKAGTVLAMANEQKIFEQKCTLCHGTARIFSETLTPESRRHVVMRMQERAGDWITPKDAEAILDYLKNAKEPDLAMPQVGKQPVDTRGLPPAEVFRTRCSACHSLERVYLKVENGTNAETWNHIIHRMQSKNPQWLDESDADKIFSYLRSLKPVIKGKNDN